MKICKIIFSANRLEFLIPTLNTAKDNLNWGDHEVDGLFIDDMPEGRDDNKIRELAESHGYNNIILHKENKGVGFSWHEAYDWLKGKGYDYIFHQEDDLKILRLTNIDDLIKVSLEKNLTTISFKYGGEVWYDPNAKTTPSYNWKTDNPNFNYLLDCEILKQKNIWKGEDEVSFDNMHLFFNVSCSLCNANNVLDAYQLAQDAGLGKNGISMQEGTFGEFVTKVVGKSEWGLHIVDKDNNNLSEHIGDWSWGTISTLEEIEKEQYNDWQRAKMTERTLNPYKKYNSRDWSDW